ncbi:MAG: protein kinase [Labilithrix sp.]
MDCLGDTTMLAYLGGSLAPAQASAIEHHLGGCAECCASIAECAALLEEDPDTSVQAPPAEVLASAPKTVGRGQRVGRYEIVEPIGRGGMSVVYRARDPELDRDVAIKIVRPELSLREGPEESKARLMREARAMARVAHPNVVAIYDVGEWEEQIFVAMELVEGDTLKAYLRKARRPLKTILDLFLAAGQGLVAAHGADLVHRDFKPENVLVGNDGRPRVLDFGLARSVDLEEATGGLSGAPVRGSGPLGALTRTGAVAGTPAYMSPEQFTGQSLDARTDQFSFCVALYEALYDERPFGGDSVDKLAEQVLQSDVRPAPAGSAVPESLRATLLRGLAKRPDDRFPTLAELLEALASSRDALVAPPSLILAEPFAPPAAKPRRGNLGPGIALGLAGAALFLGAIGLVVQSLRPPAARPEPPVLAANATANANGAPSATPSDPASSAAIELPASAPTSGPASAAGVSSATRATSNKRRPPGRPGAPARPNAPAPLGDKVENPF